MTIRVFIVLPYSSCRVLPPQLRNNAQRHTYHTQSSMASRGAAPAGGLWLAHQAPPRPLQPASADSPARADVDDEESMADFTEGMIETMASAAGMHPILPLVTLSLNDEDEKEEEGKPEGCTQHHLCLRIDEAVEEGHDHLHELDPTVLSPSFSQSSRANKFKGMCGTLKKLRPVLLLLVLVTTSLVSGSYLVVRYRDKVLEASEYIRQEAPRSAVYYALIVALWIILCLPSTIIELLGGAIFSFPVALLTLTVGKQLGCTIAFLIGKVVASKAIQDALSRPHRSSSSTVEVAEAEGQRERSNINIALAGSDEQKKVSHGGRRERQSASASSSDSSSSRRSSTKLISKRKRTIQAMFYAMECHPWKITLLLRFLPIPISVKNYGMACLPCPTHVFFISTFVASLPFTFIWVNLGESTKSLLEALSGKGGATGKRFFAQEIALLVVGLLLLVLLVVILKRYTHRYAAVLEAEETARLAAAAAAAVAEEGAGGGREEHTTVRSPLTLSSMPTWTLTEGEGGDEDGRKEGDENEDERSCFGQRRRSRESFVEREIVEEWGGGDSGGEVPPVVVHALIEDTEESTVEGNKMGRNGEEEEKEEVRSPSSVASVA